MEGSSLPAFQSVGSSLLQLSIPEAVHAETAVMGLWYGP
jgi:hypothetical protein